MTAFDVAIVGAGPAGSSAAYHLAKCGLQVLLLERHGFPRDKACGDGITRKSTKLLAEMGLVEQLQHYRKVYGVRITMDAKGYRDSMFRNLEADGHSYGFVVPRRELDHLICQKAVEAGATLWEKTTVTGPVLEDDRINGVIVRRNGTEKKIRANFVVAADGGHSRFARMIGLVDDDRWSVGHAVRGYYTDISDLDDLFMVYFPLLDPDRNREVAGYGWVFPLTGAKANIGVGFFPSQQQDFGVNLRRLFDHFVQELRKRDVRFADMKLLGQLRGAPLSCGMDASRCVGNDVIVVGDAAGLVNPFTGEGISTALESGKFAAQVLTAALALPDPTQADLTEYNGLLEEHYRDLFRAGRKALKTYSFMWKVLNITFEIQRPLFDNLRHVMIDYEIGEDPYADFGSIRAAPWLKDMNILAALGEVRELLSSTIRADFPLLWEVCSKLLDLSVSFLRPTLLLLSSHWGEPNNRGMIPTATSIELAHLASTLHSNVLRNLFARQVSTPQKSYRGTNWANMFTIMSGDYVLVKSYELAAGVCSESSQKMSQGIAKVWIGTMRAVEQAHNLDQGEGNYLEIIEKKTATFYELPCRLGAEMSRATHPVIDLLADYGHNLGMALQLSNDILDIMAHDIEPVKHPIFRAFEDGIYTLPMIYSLSTIDDRKLREILSRSIVSEGEINTALAILRSNGSLSYTQDKVRFYVDCAKESLGPLPDIPAKWALTTLADFVVDRVLSCGQVH